MTKKTNKKAFTIVELVIVIAVIAILAAVLIPTFSNIIQKSKVSSDQQLIRNLNTALSTDAAVNGKHANMQSALDTAFEYGYDVTKIEAKATGNKILWDQVNDVFCYLDGDKVAYIPQSVETGLQANDYRLWVISSTVDAKYSTYYTGTETTISTSKGFDAGKSAVSTINYSNNGDAQKDVRIRTTSGTLTINAEKDTVHHYGEGLVLTINAIAGASYHEHGFFPKATISKGRIVVEEKAILSQINVVNAIGPVKVTANAETTIVVDASSGSQTTVEANTDNVFVEGLDSANISGSNSSNVKLPTEVATESELRAAVGEFIKLASDITITTDSPIAINGKTILDLNGHNISFANEIGDETDLFEIGKNGYLTISGSGKITTNSRMIHVNGELRVESGTFVTTVMTNGANSHSGIIAEEGSKVTINGGNFYTAKCAITSFGDLVINDGTFVSIASNKMPKTAIVTDPYSYTIRIEGGAVINGGSVYGIQGAIAVDGGDAIINNVYAEASAAALGMYNSVQESVHHLNVEDTTYAVSDFSETTFLNNAYYPLYCAGEFGVVSTTVNGGEFVNKGPQVAASVGNSTIGDGGERLDATVIFNGGKFVAEKNANVICVDYYVGTIQLAGGNYNKNQIKCSHGTPSTIILTDADAILAEGYKVVSETDETWSVVKK